MTGGFISGGKKGCATGKEVVPKSGVARRKSKRATG